MFFQAPSDRRIRIQRLRVAFIKFSAAFTMLVSLLCIAGCVGSPTQKNYKAAATAASRTDHPVVSPTLIESQDFVKDLKTHLTNGWTLLGKSEYNGRFPSAAELKKQAKKVGATAVLYSAQFITTRSDVSSFGMAETDPAFHPFAYAYPPPYYSASRPVSPSPSQTITYEFDVFEVHAAFLTR